MDISGFEALNRWEKMYRVLHIAAIYIAGIVLVSFGPNIAAAFVLHEPVMAPSLLQFFEYTFKFLCGCLVNFVSPWLPRKAPMLDSLISLPKSKNRVLRYLSRRGNIYIAAAFYTVCILGTFVTFAYQDLFITFMIFMMGTYTERYTKGLWQRGRLN